MGHGDNTGNTGNDVTQSAQRPEDTDGSNGSGDNDVNNATGVSLQVLKQRKRARSLSIDTATPTFGTPGPDTGYLLDGPHLAKRQRPYPRTGDESVPKRTLTPNPESSWASEAGTGETRSRMDNECIGSGHNGEVVVGGETNARDNRKADRGDGDDSGDYAGGDESLEYVEPSEYTEYAKHAEYAETAEQPASPLRQSPSHQHGAESLRQVGGDRIVDNDHGSRSPVRTTRRRHRAKSLRTATTAKSYAQRSAAKLLGYQMSSPESHLPSDKTVASSLHDHTLSETAKGTARLESNGDGRPIHQHLHKVSEITLRPISMGVLFLAATIQTAGDVL